MTDEPKLSDEDTKFLITKIVRALDGGSPDRQTILHKIRMDLRAGTLTRRSATENLADLIYAARTLQQTQTLNPHEEVRKGVEEHFDRAVEQIYEIADEFSLPVARMVIKNQRNGTPGRHR